MFTQLVFKHKSSISLTQISVVIPVKDNQQGIDTFLKTFFQTHEPNDYPLELIIVDNNSVVPIAVSQEFLDQTLEITVYQCLNPGPASARNLGAKHARGQWLLFVDSDCIPTQSMVSGYLTNPSKAVGYQGLVGAFGRDYVSKYYESQQIHQPPHKMDGTGKRIPKYLVTANILVLKKAFESVEGFDESYSFAGEDIDFGTRLSKVGKIKFATEAVVLHNYNDGFYGLMRRFIEYGKGNRFVQKKLEMPLYPLPFRPKNRKVLLNYFFAFIQWICLSLGFTFKSIELMIKRRQ